MYQNYNDEYLSHFGIKGMKWGVRRYQNPDGTYTAAGKKRLQKQVLNGTITDTPYKINTHKDVKRYYKSESRRINQAERSGQASAEIANYRRKALDKNVKNMHDAIDKRKADYKQDEKIRKALQERGYGSTRALKAYEKAEKTESIKSKLIKNPNQERSDMLNKLHEDSKRAERINEYNANKLKDHVDNMINKYGKEKVKSYEKSVHVKNGKTYVKDFLMMSSSTSLNYNYSVEKHPDIDSKGNRTNNYQLIRYV